MKSRLRIDWSTAWLDFGAGSAFGHNSVWFYVDCIRLADGYGFVASGRLT
jgi:hypothetical protein